MRTGGAEAMKNPPERGLHEEKEEREGEFQKASEFQKDAEARYTAV
jgi:hypothetical protein